jgi:vacuolar-type H+-ATPase subunit I/STV1
MTPFFAPFYLIFSSDSAWAMQVTVLMMAVAVAVAETESAQGAQSTMNLLFYLGLSTIVFGILGGTSSAFRCTKPLAGVQHPRSEYLQHRVPTSITCCSIWR